MLARLLSIIFIFGVISCRGPHKKTYYENGKLKEYTSYYSSFSNKRIEERKKRYVNTFYKNGNRKQRIFYYKNGKIKEDKMTKKSIRTYYENGKKKVCVQYKSNGEIKSNSPRCYSSANKKEKCSIAKHDLAKYGITKHDLVN